MTARITETARGTRRPRWLLPLAGGLALAGLFAWHCARYHPFFADDAFISLRYAQRLLAGDGLTWTAGEAVEGYSNLLWVLLISGGGALGLDLIAVARALGVLSGLGAVVLVYRSQPQAPLAGLVSASALALCGPLAVWSIGGLEQPLVALLLAGAVVATWRLFADGSRRPLGAGLCLAALCLTRPDGPLFVALFATALTVQRRQLGAGLRLALPAVIAVSGQVLFRRLYYADWLPNPAYMKASWSAHRLSEGLAWTRDGLWTLIPVLCLALLGLLAGVADRGRRARIALVWAAAALWTGYVTSVGGDIFPAHRHLVPALVLLAFAGAEGAAWAMAQATDRRGVALPLFGLVLALMPLQEAAEANRRALSERWEWDAVPVGRLLHTAFARHDPLLAVTAAGALPYFSRLRCLDMLGLNDRHIARQAGTPGGYIGHDHADGAYVLDRAPDLMIWGTPTGGLPRHEAGRQVKADPRFARAYRRVRLRGFEPTPITTTAYARLDGPLGVRRATDRIEVPAWLLGPPAVGVLDGAAELVARLPANQTLRSAPIALPAGQWALRTDPPDGAVGITIEAESSFAAGAGRVAGPTTVRIQVATRSLPSDLRALIFERRAGPTPDTTDALLLRPRPAASVGAPERILHGFDTPDPGDWRLEGIPIALAAVPGQAPVRGRRGGVLNSFLPRRGDRATGRAWSGIFQAAPRTALRLRIAGGDRDVGVRLRASGRVIATWTGQRDERLRPVLLDLSAHVGQPLQLEVFDDAQGAWGHVVVDAVEVVRWTPAQVVSN